MAYNKIFLLTTITQIASFKLPYAFSLLISVSKTSKLSTAHSNHRELYRTGQNQPHAGHIRILEPLEPKATWTLGLNETT